MVPPTNASFFKRECDGLGPLHRERHVEPRLSGNVLLRRRQCQTSLGWGIYNAPLNLSVIEQALDQQQVDIFF